MRRGDFDAEKDIRNMEDEQVFESLNNALGVYGMSVDSNWFSNLKQAGGRNCIWLRRSVAW